ncbi:MAG: hypothetical protein GY851_26465, partial [bacterium]|nr:hypothetical protein [bacterium]
SRPGLGSKSFEYTWFLGDFGVARGPMVTHAFFRSGVFPVRLIVDDGVNRDSTTQWITVSRGTSQRGAVGLFLADEPSFRPWCHGATEVYGEPVRSLPHTVQFVEPSTGAPTVTKSISLKRFVGDKHVGAPAVESGYETRGDWLEVTSRRGTRDVQLQVSVDATGLKPGEYAAWVHLSWMDLADDPQDFRVELRVSGKPPRANITVDDADPGFYATPHFWVGHRFCRCPEDRRGYGGFYLTNGSRAAADEFARFTPDLHAGEYDVSL